MILVHLLTVLITIFFKLFYFFITDLRQRPDKPPVIIKVKEGAKRKLEFNPVSVSGLLKKKKNLI